MPRIRVEEVDSEQEVEEEESGEEEVDSEEDVEEEEEEEELPRMRASNRNRSRQEKSRNKDNEEEEENAEEMIRILAGWKMSSELAPIIHPANVPLSGTLRTMSYAKIKSYYDAADILINNASSGGRLIEHTVTWLSGEAEQYATASPQFRETWGDLTDMKKNILTNPAIKIKMAKLDIKYDIARLVPDELMLPLLIGNSVYDTMMANRNKATSADDDFKRELPKIEDYVMEHNTLPPFWRWPFPAGQTAETVVQRIRGDVIRRRSQLAPPVMGGHAPASEPAPMMNGHAASQGPPPAEMPMIVNVIPPELEPSPPVGPPVITREAIAHAFQTLQQQLADNNGVMPEIPPVDPEVEAQQRNSFNQFIQSQTGIPNAISVAPPSTIPSPEAPRPEIMEEKTSFPTPIVRNLPGIGTTRVRLTNR